MKSIKTRQFIHGLILFCGLVLMIGGVITGKHGATVGGIIIAGVNAQQWIQWQKKVKKKVMIDSDNIILNTEFIA